MDGCPELEAVTLLCRVTACVSIIDARRFSITRHLVPIASPQETMGYVAEVSQAS